AFLLIFLLFSKRWEKYLSIGKSMKKIWLSPPHMSGNELKYIHAAPACVQGLSFLREWYFLKIV
ncbi:MAG: hypothetical protein KGY70_20535, partial [Bacteroidales bacterium]|nr:hypothetical protein [Bacteroidales bacterium]MBS3777593.1 hypothetical protein [Bacteroidales bacterium]